MQFGFTMGLYNLGGAFWVYNLCSSHMVVQFGCIIQVFNLSVRCTIWANNWLTFVDFSCYSVQFGLYNLGVQFGYTIWVYNLYNFNVHLYNLGSVTFGTTVVLDGRVFLATTDFWAHP